MRNARAPRPTFCPSPAVHLFPPAPLPSPFPVRPAAPASLTLTGFSLTRRPSVSRQSPASPQPRRWDEPAPSRSPPAPGAAGCGAGGGGGAAAAGEPPPVRHLPHPVPRHLADVQEGRGFLLDGGGGEGGWCRGGEDRQPRALVRAQYLKPSFFAVI